MGLVARVFLWFPQLGFGELDFYQLVSSHGIYLYFILSIYIKCSYIYILLFTNDVVLLASSPKGLQTQLDALALFCYLHQLTVNLGITKVMTFNGLKKVLLDHHFFFRGEEIEITTIYTYLGVQFTRPCFSMRHALQHLVNKGYGSLALLERQCFRNHFQDILSKMSLMDTLVWPTVLYGSQVWGPLFLESDWALVERMKILLLRHRQMQVGSPSAHRPCRVWCSGLLA